MPQTTRTFTGLSGNQLKLIALFTMTVDHVGLQLLPELIWMRMVGRLSFPIFAYMIAEGCRHTKHPARYLGTMAGMGLLCQLVYFFAMCSLYQCVLVTFTLSILLIYTLRYAREEKSALGWLFAGLTLAVAVFICAVLPQLLPGTDFSVDYGIFGVLLPVMVYLGRSKWEKLGLIGVGLVLLALVYGSIQWLGLLALVPLALYSGKRGAWRMKNLFYIYYPLHLVVIWAISLFI